MRKKFHSVDGNSNSNWVRLGVNINGKAATLEMLSPAEMHYLGLKIIHQIDELPSDFRSTGNGIKYRRFRSFYGVDPETCCDVLADIETLAPVGLRIQNADPSKLLMALEWVNTNKKDLELQVARSLCFEN